MMASDRHRPAGGQAVHTSGSHVPLVDVVDRLLETGVVVSGDVLLSVAGVDLVQLGLRAVLEGIDGRTKTVADPAPAPGTAHPQSAADPETPSAAGEQSAARDVLDPAASTTRRSGAATPRPLRVVPVAGGDAVEPTAGPRVGIDPDRVEHGLVQLVLTVVEVLRQVLERQALRRVETDQLSSADVEALGTALLRLYERMEDLKVHFGLHDEDLVLRLGEVRDAC